MYRSTAVASCWTNGVEHVLFGIYLLHFFSLVNFSVPVQRCEALVLKACLTLTPAAILCLLLPISVTKVTVNNRIWTYLAAKLILPT